MGYVVCIWIVLCARLRFCFLFFLSAFQRRNTLPVAPCTVHKTHKPLFFSNFFIKNGSYDTIHTFKNYFVVVFSVK